MAPVHTQKFTHRSQTTVNKPTGIIWFSNWLCITTLLASTTAQTNHNTLATTDQNKALKTILLANIFRNTDIEAAILHEILNQASNSKSRISRSPRATKTIQALEAAITMFTQNQPEPEYLTSEYATGNKCWKRAPSVYPFQITDLLEHEVRNKHSQNKILGEKVAQILHQNTDLSDKIAEEYQTPSEKLKKDPIMALVTKTVSTYMLIRHSKNSKDKHKAEDFSSWGEPFFKKKE
jgi:hypothetical protein